MSSRGNDTPLKVQRWSVDTTDPDGQGRDVLADVPGLVDLWGRMTPKQGGEVSLEGRLEGRQPWEIIVRRDTGSDTISAKDVLVTLDRDARKLEVTSAAPYQADPAYILITAVEGGPRG